MPRNPSFCYQRLAVRFEIGLLGEMLIKLDISRCSGFRDQLENLALRAATAVERRPAAVRG